MTRRGAGLVLQSSLRGRLQFLLKDSVLYGGATAVARLLSIFTVPILARLFSRTEFGVVDALAVLGTVFVPLMTMGQDSAVARFFYEQEDERERREVISQSLLFELALIAACTAGLYLFAGPLMQALFSSGDQAPAFRVVALSLPFQVLLNYGQNILKWTFNRWRFLFVSIGSVALTVALTLVFVVILRRGILGVFYAQLASRVIFAAVGLFFCRSWFVRPAHYRHLFPMFQFGWPYMLLGVSGCLMPMIDRYFIVNRLSLEAMGLYAAGAKLAMLIQLPIQGFQTAWGPFAFAIYKDAKASQTYDAVLLCYTAGLCLAGYLLVALARPLLLVLVSAKYLESQFLVLPMVLALIIDSLSWITGIGIDISKKTPMAVISYAAGVAGTVAAMALLVRPFGLMGAAYAMVIGRLILTVTKTFLAHRLYPLAFHYARPAGLILASFGMNLLTDRYLPFSWSPGPIAVRVLLAVVLALVACRWLAAGRAERQAAAARPA
ncbi:MAG: oligosaccharide flippase family protein [Kiritimatiellae bacterium]|nr:oligosaccharide flippase family protein [Kiritimatiellia bacterium]